MLAGLSTLSLNPGSWWAAAPAESASRPGQGRRYVTGVDAEGRSCLVDIGEIPASARWKDEGAEGYDFWVVPRLPAALHEASNPSPEYESGNQAPPGGLIGRLITWAPGFSYPMHETPTLDFILVVSGQLELGLDTGGCLLGPGDVLIQRHTLHRWHNPGPGPCTFAVIMMDAGRQ